MSYNLNAECPCCNKIASNDLNKILQSYCKVCRSKKCSPTDKRCQNYK